MFRIFFWKNDNYTKYRNYNMHNPILRIGWYMCESYFDIWRISIVKDLYGSESAKLMGFKFFNVI